MNRSHPLGMHTPLAFLLLAVAWPSSALATGSLTISLQDDRSRAIEGTVTARPQSGGQAHTCSTHGGSCTIRGLTAGRHQVSATVVRRGFVVQARTVAVVEDRTATVRLTAVAANAPATQTQTLEQTPGAGAVPGSTSGSTRPGGAGAGAGVTVRPGGAVQSASTAVRPGGAGRGGRTPVLPHTAPRTTGQSAQVTAIGQTTATAQTAQVTARNLGTGEHATVMGTTQDQRSRRVEGTITVTQNATTIGTVATHGGSFTAFDLSPGSYSFSFTAVSGERTSRNVTIVDGPVMTIRLTVTR